MPRRDIKGLPVRIGGGILVAIQVSVMDGGEGTPECIVIFGIEASHGCIRDSDVGHLRQPRRLGSIDILLRNQTTQSTAEKGLRRSAPENPNIRLLRRTKAAVQRAE